MTKYLKTGEINGIPVVRAYSSDNLTEEEEMMEDQMRILKNSLYGKFDRTLDGDICLDENFRNKMLETAKNYGKRFTNEHDS